MTTQEIKKALAGLTDEELREVTGAVGDATQKRRKGIQLEDIKPGMTPEQVKAAWDEIAYWKKNQ